MGSPPRDPNFLTSFDQISYLLGLLTGALLTWLLGKLGPLLTRAFTAIKKQSQISRQARRLGDEIRLANDILRVSQSWHLASQLFSLDEIVIPPRVLAPPIPPMAFEPPPSEDITDWAIPYLNDWPELASYYGAPSLSLAEALSGNANLIVTGQPGAGKTVALVHLATQIIRRESLPNNLFNLNPLLLHVANLSPTYKLPELEENQLEPFDVLLKAVSGLATSISKKHLPGFLRTILKQGRAVLILDGLDELPPSLVLEISEFLSRLIEQFPDLRIVVAASPDNLGGLLSLGFQPLPLVSWSKDQTATFIHRWSHLWKRYIEAPDSSGPSLSDPLLLIGWLTNTSFNLSPLELTLKVWAAFAGDSLGPSLIATIESYIRRMTAKQPEKNRLAIEQLASQIVLATQPIIDIESAEKWLGGTEMVDLENVTSSEQDESPVEEPTASQSTVRARGALPSLVESNLITLHASNYLTMVHPVITGYLASRGLSSSSAMNQLISQPEWTGKLIALRFLVVMNPNSPWIGKMIKEEEVDPLLSGLFRVSRWLQGAPEGSPWISGVLGKLADYLQQDSVSMNIRGRALCALLLSGNPSLPELLHRMLISPFVQSRQLAALGCGFMRDTKSVAEINKLITDPSPGVNRSAILALVAIGKKEGLDVVAYTLIHGDESLCRSVAEALSNHPEEGFPTLEEGSTFENPAVRKAVVFGLGRVGKIPHKRNWAIEILEKMRTEDSQWLVQDAATQMLQTLRGSDPRLPKSLPLFHNMSWLISFSAERSMGVPPGKPAHEMLYRSLKDGNEDQCLAALYSLSQYGDEGAILPLYQTYFTSRGEVRDYAFNAMWNLAASGVNLPPPIQYGLR